MTEQERAEVKRMFAYLPELQTLWRFSQEVYQLWDTRRSRPVARWRWSRLKNNKDYQRLPELKGVLGGLNEDKFEKTQAFLQQPLCERLKTNNHVERANRALRFDEK